jgi:hypothetical protein
VRDTYVITCSGPWVTLLVRSHLSATASLYYYICPAALMDFMSCIVLIEDFDRDMCTKVKSSVTSSAQRVLQKSHPNKSCPECLPRSVMQAGRWGQQPALCAPNFATSVHVARSCLLALYRRKPPKRRLTESIGAVVSGSLKSLDSLKS